MFVTECTVGRYCVRYSPVMVQRICLNITAVYLCKNLSVYNRMYVRQVLCQVPAKPALYNCCYVSKHCLLSCAIYLIQNKFPQIPSNSLVSLKRFLYYAIFHYSTNTFRHRYQLQQYQVRVAVRNLNLHDAPDTTPDLSG